jgi:hypothetical protein
MTGARLSCGASRHPTLVTRIAFLSRVHFHMQIGQARHVAGAGEVRRPPVWRTITGRGRD